METYTNVDLGGRSDLLPVFSEGDDFPVAYVHSGDTSFNGNIESYLKSAKKEIRFPIYRRCKASSKIANEPIFSELQNFEQTRTGWENSLRNANNSVKLERAHAFRDNNMRFARMYVTGKVDEYLHCSITGQQIDSLIFEGGQPMNIFEAHHFMVKNRASVQKESEDPGAIFRRFEFSEPSGQTLNAVKDMMRTIFLSPTGHKIVHNRWNDSDITNYKVDQLPFALQSQDNWNMWMAFLEGFGYIAATFGTFDDWIESLKF